MTPTPEQIAASLTTAQREALRTARAREGQNAVWITRMHLRAIPGLYRKGLVDFHTAPARVNSDGLAVAEIIRSENDER